MKKVRFGILSTAGIAQQELIPAIQRSANAEVVAIASSSNVEKATAVAEKFHIRKVHNSYEALLSDATIDAVYIPLPNHLHKEWAIKAAEQGKHVLCEKPAAINREEVIEMKQVFEKNNVLFMEAFMYYFHPQHERVKQIIDSGEIGEISYLRAAHSFLMKDMDSNIRMKYPAGGGSLYDVGCYAIHALRNVLRKEPESVHVHAVKDVETGIDRQAYAYLTFPNGVRATFDASFESIDRHEYEVVGTEGRIIVPRAFRPDRNGGDGLVIIEKSNVTRTETINTDQYRKQVEHISEAILAGANKLDLEIINTMNNMRVIDACMESIQTGKLVKLS